MKWLGLLVAVVACSDSFKPTTENVSGDYQLQSFTSDSAGVHTDWVAAGASLELLLSPVGDVIGTLVMPCVGSIVCVADMTGTWDLSGNSVHFTQTAVTFVRGMDWIAGKDRLSADETSGTVRFRVVLQRKTVP